MNKLNFSQADYHKVKLSDILTEYYESAPKGGKYEHVSLTQAGVVPKTERFNRDFLVTTDNKKYRITHKDDICYNPANLKFHVICRNTYGDAIFSPIYVTFKVNDKYDPAYIAYAVMMDSFIASSMKYQEGTVYERMAVSPEDLLTMEINVPNLDTQKKIAKMLSKIDTKIDLIKNKVEKLKDLKASMLAKMFPEDGESVPKIRFKGFAEPWQQRKVGEMTVELKNYATLESEYPLLTSSRNGLMFQDEYRDRVTTDNKNTLFSIVPRNKCTYRHMSDDNIFHFNVNELVDNGLVSKEYPVFECNENNNLNFLVQYLNYSPYFTKFCSERKLGGTRTRLYYKNLCDFSFCVPCKQEQDAIATYFIHLDNLMKLHQREYEKLLDTKKAFLEKLIGGDN